MASSGNGLEHIDKNKVQKVHGIDINRGYLKAVEQVQLQYVSCIDRINIDDSRVSDSSYTHVFMESRMMRLHSPFIWIVGRFCYSFLFQALEL